MRACSTIMIQWHRFAVAVMCLQSVYGLDLQDQACAAKYGASKSLQVTNKCNIKC